MTSPWWTTDRHLDRKAALRLRAELLRDIRTWFDTEGFIEVEPSCLQISPGNETHVHAFATVRIDQAGKSSPLYLHTSPEFAMKKLLSAGEEKIFSASRVFRNRELGPLHLNEFTMIEWYRTHCTYHDVVKDCASLLSIAAQTRGDGAVSYRKHRCHLDAKPEHITVAAAFQKFCNIDLLATLNADPATGDRVKLARAASHLNLTIAADDSWSDLFSKILTSYIEPRLGIDQPTFLTEYPLPEAALARVAPNDPRVGERFELYCCGIELANGFGELTDSEEQRRRFELAMSEKARIYGERYPIDEDFLSALSTMPEASGVALGFDRLALLTAGVDRLDQVVWTPDEARKS